MMYTSTCSKASDSYISISTSLFKATIGCILVSHQGFPVSSMRAGGHYHYAVMIFNRKLTIKIPLCKQNHNIPTSQTVHNIMTHL